VHYVAFASDLWLFPGICSMCALAVAPFPPANVHVLIWDGRSLSGYFERLTHGICVTFTFVACVCSVL
jgi:hypothetical protein